MRKKILYSLSALTILAACTPKTAEVITTKPVPEIRQETAEISEGSALFADNCAKCHDLPKIPEYSSEKWQKIVPKMAHEAKLDAIQESKIMAYVNWKLGN